jgi:hypothetical protein
LFEVFHEPFFRKSRKAVGSAEAAVTGPDQFQGAEGAAGRAGVDPLDYGTDGDALDDIADEDEV